MKLVLLISLMICVYCAYVTVAEVTFTKDDKIAMTRGFNAGYELVNLFNSKKDFSAKIVNLASKASKFLGVAGPLVGFILSFVSTPESQDAKLMKYFFGIVNTKLDQHTELFKEVKNLIDWRSTQLSYVQDEKTIVTLESTFNDFMKATTITAKRVLKDKFITQYRASINEEPAVRLYNSVIKNDNLFSQNAIKASMQFTEYHRKKVQSFMLGLTQLILRGSQLEMAYYGLLKRKPEEINVYKNLWTARFKSLEKKMKEFDQIVLNQWDEQYPKDVDKLAANNYKLNNKAFSETLYNFLADKYYWRAWGVIVYKEVSGFDKHTVSSCGGSYRFRFHGRNFVFSSAPWSSKFKYSTAVSLLNGVASRVNYSTKAIDWYNYLVTKTGKYCSPYAMKAVICWGCDVWYISAAKRLVYKKIDARRRYSNKNKRLQTLGHLNVFIFG